jgi:hypothetical protein
VGKPSNRLVPNGCDTVLSGDHNLIGTKKEEWLELCEQAANEQDPKKLMALIAEIDRLLAAKQQRLKGLAPASQIDI